MGRNDNPVKTKLDLIEQVGSKDVVVRQRKIAVLGCKRIRRARGSNKKRLSKILIRKKEFRCQFAFGRLQKINIGYELVFAVGARIAEGVLARAVHNFLRCGYDVSAIWQLQI